MRLQHQPVSRPPLFACPVSTGFPSPAQDYVDKPLCLNELLVPRPAATLFIRMPDDSMQDIRIWPGDLLIADRSIKPTDGRIVAVRVLGEIIIRRLVIKGTSGWLKAENPDYPVIELKEGLDYKLLGVVRHQAHSV